MNLALWWPAAVGHCSRPTPCSRPPPKGLLRDTRLYGSTVVCPNLTDATLDGVPAVSGQVRHPISHISRANRVVWTMEEEHKITLMMEHPCF